ncbi:MAG: SpoIIE family protein phosphatase [Coriobacteriia bacterium]|nr:SpoIIE family protein phosphatase [Coriobacteriia bacterium]
MSEGIEQIGRSGAGWRAVADGAWLTLLLEGASYPAALWSGADLRFRWTNRAFLDLMDDPRPQWDLLGMPVRGFLSDTPSAVRFIDVAYTGQAFTDPEYEYRASWGETTYWQLNYLPVPGHIGNPYDVLLTAVDVTSTVNERRSVEAEARDLRQAMGLIDTTVLSSLDAGEILQRVLVESTEALKADWGWIAERNDGAWVFRNVHGWPIEMIGVAFQEDELSLPGLAAKARHVTYAAGMREGDKAKRELMAKHDIGAFLMVPIMERGEVTGVMGFCWDSEAKISEVHLELARKLEVSLSLALANARAYENERRVTRTLQSAFFTAPASLPGIELGHLYHSASGGTRVGGDFYDVLELEGGRVGVLVGDVCGESADIAALTTLVKSSMRAQALRAPSPAAVLASANDLMLRGAEPGENATAFFGMLDRVNGHMSYGCAGHPAPVLMRKNERPTLLAGSHGLSGGRCQQYNTGETVLDVGDLLVLYTGGLTQTRDRHGEIFGMDRLLSAVHKCADEPADVVPESLFLSAFSFAGGHLQDDIAIVALRRTGAYDGGTQGRLELSLAG